METIVGIEIYPMISFIIFFSFFIGLLLWVTFMKKSYVAELEQLPLNESE